MREGIMALPTTKEVAMNPRSFSLVVALVLALVNTTLAEDIHPESESKSDADIITPDGNESEIPKIEYFELELFGGYSMLRFDAGTEDPEGNNASNGWEVGATGKFLPWLGVAADFDGRSKDGNQFYHYLVGPRFYSQLENTQYGPMRFFGHVLVGGVTARGSGLPAERGFAMAVGGGGDLGGILRVQVDYILDRVDGFPNHNLRASLGIALPVRIAGQHPESKE
jgi:hypothetical protein